MTMKMDKYYLMAEYDYHMMYKRSDMITYLQSLYILLDKHNLLSDNYPEELFEGTIRGRGEDEHGIQAVSSL